MTRLLGPVKREFMLEHGYRCFNNVLELLRNYTITCVILKWNSSRAENSLESILIQIVPMSVNYYRYGSRGVNMKLLGPPKKNFVRQKYFSIDGKFFRKSF